MREVPPPQASRSLLLFLSHLDNTSSPHLLSHYRLRLTSNSTERSRPERDSRSQAQQTPHHLSWSPRRPTRPSPPHSIRHRTVPLFCSNRQQLPTLLLIPARECTLGTRDWLHADFSCSTLSAYVTLEVSYCPVVVVIIIPTSIQTLYLYFQQ